MNKSTFARSLGVSPGNLSDWLSGRSQPDGMILIRIHEIYGIDLDWLTHGQGNVASQKSAKNDLKSLDDELLKRLQTLIGRILVKQGDQSVRTVDRDEITDVVHEILEVLDEEDLLLIKKNVERLLRKRKLTPKK